MMKRVVICLAALTSCIALEVDAGWRSKQRPVQYRPRTRATQQHMREHTAAQEQFLLLQTTFGVKNPSEQVIHSVRAVKRQTATQPNFNQARLELNSLLAKTPLQADKIRQKIKSFAAMRPARWPQPQDYTELLNARLAKATKEAQLD